MSVVVRMEMPRDCYNCDMRYECNTFVANKNAKPMCKGCRIICCLPEGHGRLVDADYYAKPHAGGEMLKFAKTIVPAERSET